MRAITEFVNTEEKASILVGKAAVFVHWNRTGIENVNPGPPLPHNPRTSKGPFRGGPLPYRGCRVAQEDIVAFKGVVTRKRAAVSGHLLPGLDPPWVRGF